MGKIRERIIAYILAFCTLVSAICTGITMPVSAEEDTAGSINLHTAKVRIYNKNTGQWVDLDEMTDAVEDGDRLSISFDWTLLNVQHDVKEYKVKLPQLENVIIPDIGPQELLYGSTPIGTFKIENGVLIIDITESWYLDEMGERYGGVTVEGEIAVNGGFEQDGKRVPVIIGDYEGEVTYKTSATESGLNVSKSAEGTVEKGSDGKYRQTFRVSLKPYGEYITINSLVDELRDGLGQGSMSDWTVVACPSENSELSDLKLGEAYSLDALNEMLTGKKLYEGEALIFEYTVEVSEDIYKQDGGGKDYKNYFSIDYTTNAGNSKTGQDDAAASANRPTIKKSGEINEDDQTVEWTITIDLKDWKDKTIEKVIDELGSGFVEQNIPISKDDFHETPEGSGIWVATYTTHISEEVQNSPSSTMLKNKVTVTVGGNEYTAEASVASHETTWVEKTATGYDPDKKLITWVVTLQVPSDTEVKNVSVKDIPNTSGLGQHTLQTTAVWVDGELVVENGQKVASDEIIKEYNNYYGIYIVFNDTYIQKHAGQSIKITYTTLVEDDVNAGKVYKNGAQLSYFDATVGPEGGNVSQSTEADWKHEVERDVLDKEGEPKPNENAIEYTLKINIDDIQDLAEGGEIVIIDELPDGLQLDENSVKFTDYALYPEWNAENQMHPENFGSRATTGDHEGTEGTIKFTIPVTAYTLLNKEQLAGDAWGFYYIYVTYKATVKDASALTRNGGASYTNKATATYNEKKVGSAENETELRPKQVVTKKGEYSKETAPYIYYTIEVNPDALDLSDGWLIAKDTLGSALNYDLDSIVVEKKSADGYSWEKLIAGTHYTYSYNASENSVSFRLPDGEYLKITYRAFVNLTYTSDGALTKENSFNHFELSGFGFPEAESKKDFDKSEIFQPAGWAAGTTGSITIQKYWTYDDQMVKLNGATFKLSMVVGNDTTSSPMPLQTVDGYESFTIDSNEAIGMKTIDGLRLDQIYVIEEISAPEGFAVGEPYYFVLTGSDNVTLPDGLNGKNCAVKDDIIYYENFPSTLVITKTVTGGDVSREMAEQFLQFTVTKKGASGEENTTKYQGYLSDFKYDEETQTWTKELNLSPGEYIVEETLYDIDGKVTKKVTYTVNSSTGETTLIQDGSPVEGVEAPTVIVTESGRVTVAYKDTYEEKVIAPKTGSLTIKKTVTGGPTFDAIKDEESEELSFKVWRKEEGDQDTLYATLPNETVQWTYSVENGYTLTLDNLPPGEYYVEEIASNIVTSGGKQYVLTKTTYQVDDNEPETDCTATKTTSDISIKTDENTEVTFKNTYAVNEGKLILRKKIDGIQNDGQDADAQTAWNAVKDSLTFDVSKYDTSTVPATYKPYESISGDDQRWKIEGGYAVLELTGLPVGNYKVEETSGTLKDYSIEGIVCEVDPSNGVTIDGASAENIDVTRETDVKVTFINTYISNNAELELEKKISGILDKNGDAASDEAAWNAIKDKITFVISDGKTEITVKGSDIGWEYDAQNRSYKYKVPLTAGTYTVEEQIMDIMGYTLKTVTYTVTTSESGTTGQTRSGSKTSDIQVKPSSNDVIVSFYNEYEQHKGTLVLTKEVTGLSDDVLKTLIEKGEITFTIQNVETEKKYTFTLSDFIDNGNGNYTLTFDGEIDNQGKLPAGTYTIVESGFNLENYQTEVEYEVKPKDLQGPEGIGNQTSFIIKKDKETEVTFTNNYSLIPGTLTLKKTLSGDLEWKDVWDSLSFEVRDSSGNEIDGSPFSFTAEDLNKQEHIISLELAPGEYTVKEIVTDKNGYTRTTTYTVNSELAEPDSEGKVKVTVASGQNSSVEIGNNYAQDKGALELTKTVNGPISKEQAAAITFTIKGPGYEKTVTLDEFNYDDGKYTLRIENLPVGNYTVEETAYTVEGYKVTVSYQITSGSGGTLIEENIKKVDDLAVGVEIEKNGNTQINYVDTYVEIPPETGSLILQKMVSGDLKWDQVKESLRFEITDSSGNAIDGSPFSWEQFELNQEKTAYVLKITGLKPDTYTVKETFISEKEKENYTRTTTYTVGDEITVASPYDEDGVKVEVSANGENTVTFINNYSLDRGNLTITKTVEGPVSKDDVKKITFTVTGTGADGSTYNKTFTLGDELGDEKFRYENGKYILELNNLPVGEYTVTETHYDIDGFITEEVSYKINNQNETKLVEKDKEVSKEAAKATVEKGKTVTVDYKDVYKAETKGSLDIEKTVTGLSWEKLPEYISFTVTGPNGYERTITADEFNKNGNSYTYTIDDLKLGTYTVTENIIQEEKGYTRTTSYVVGTGNPTEGMTATVEFTEDSANGKVTFNNDYEQNKGSLQLTKIVTGLSADELNEAINSGKIKFVIKNTETKKEYPYTLVNFEDNSDGSYTLKLEGEKSLPEGEYTIVESDFALPNYTTGIKYVVKNGSSGSGEEVSFTVDKDTMTEVTITNTYTSTKGSLVIEKQVTRDPNSPIIGWEDVKKYLTFEIREVGGDYKATISAEQFTDEDGNGIYSYTITGLDVGKSYIVTETSSAVPDYNCEVTYTVSGSAERFNETEAKATVSATEGATVKFTNCYTYVKETPPLEDDTVTSEPSPSPAPPTDPSPSPSVTSPSPSQTPAQTSSPKPSSSPIKQLEVSPTPSPSPLPEDGSVLAAERDRVPQTSDYFFMWLSLFLVSMSSLMGYLVYLDKKNRKE